MWPILPTILETAIYAASDLLADDSTPETPDGNPVDMPDSEPIEDPESSPFKQHHERDPAPDTKDVTEADFVHALHDEGYTHRELATLLYGEIMTIMEGREREAKRRETSDTASNDGGQAAATGNRGDRIAQLGWR